MGGPDVSSWEEGRTYVSVVAGGRRPLLVRRYENVGSRTTYTSADARLETVVEPRLGRGGPECHCRANEYP